MNEFEPDVPLHILPETDVRQLTELAEELLSPEVYTVPGEDGPIEIRKYIWKGPTEHNQDRARASVNTVRRLQYKQRDMLRVESHTFTSTHAGANEAQVRTYYAHLDSGLFLVERKAYQDFESHQADTEGGVRDVALYADMWAMEFALGLYTPDETDLPDMQALLRAGAAHRLEQAFAQREGLRAKVARLPWLRRFFTA